MVAATTGETIVALAIVVGLVGPLIALGWITQVPGALTRADAWALEHPWGSAAIVAACLFVPILIGVALLSAPLSLAFLASVLYFAVSGWSLSRDPARRSMRKRAGLPPE